MLDNAVALVDAETWEVLFENAQFFRWFPAAVEEVEILTERVPEFNVERAKSRLEADRPYSFETKSRTLWRAITSSSESSSSRRRKSTPRKSAIEGILRKGIGQHRTRKAPRHEPRGLGGVRTDR